MSVKTQGTHLYFAAGDPLALMKMTCPTGITGLGGPKTQIPNTCLDELHDERFISGLGQPGTVSVPFILKPTEADHQQLFELKESGETIRWMGALSDGTAAPTLTDNEIEAPTGRTSFGFDAYVADVNIDIATNELVRGTLELQRSGKVDWTWKS